MPEETHDPEKHVLDPDRGWTPVFGQDHAQWKNAMNAPLPGPLNDNPQLDRWVAFPAPGKVIVLTGRVELGQGVLTAMAQIAADELDVAIGRITMRSGDTENAPNEGYTAGSQAIQFGGVAIPQASADVRA